MPSVAGQFHQLRGKSRPVVATCLYGLVASLAAVAFQLAINVVYNAVYKSNATGTLRHFGWVSLLAISSSSLVVGLLLSKLCPEAAGSGIPQVKLAFWKEFGHAPRRIAWIKFAAGVFAIGGGQSLGREGPSVQIGSNLAASLAGLLGVSKQNRRAPSAAGAAAGLAAAFNAPLASVAFVLEEIIGDLNSRSLGPVLLASVIGAFVVHALIGAQPAFLLPTVQEPTWRAYLLMPLAAAFAGLTGIVFQRGGLQVRKWSRATQVLPRWLHPLAAGLLTWAIGMAVFSGTGRLGVFSLGYDDLTDSLVHGLAWKLALLLLAGKLAATILCYGLGGCGGIFSPNLFFGAMCGEIVAGLGVRFLHINRSDELLLTIGGMSACLGAVVQAPVTAILIIFEMTHQFAVVPGLMLAGLVGQAVARSLEPENFYERVLEQDGHRMEHLVPPRDLRTWHNLPISAIAHFNPVAVQGREPAQLAELLEHHPYRFFPVMEEGRLTGIASRASLEKATAAGGNGALAIEPAVTCRPDQSIRDSQHQLIESPANLVIVAEKPEGPVLGLVTLHDLLRAQVAMSDREGGA